MKHKNAQLDALVDSKKEYIDHLFDLLTEPMVSTFQEMYQQCLAAPETRKKGILASFQDALVGIASWNQHLIHEHYGKVVAHTGCKYIPDLIRALISVQVKINLMANSCDPSSHHIKLRIPSADNFVHRCYVDVARAVWKRPYLLYHNVRAVEKQQNLLDLEKIIQHAIRTVLRGYVPMEQLIAQIQLDAQSQTDTEPSDTESSDTESSDTESSDTESSDTESEVDYVTVVHEDSESEPEPEREPEPVFEAEPNREPEPEHEAEPNREPEPEPVFEVVEVEQPEVVSVEEPFEMDNEVKDVQTININEDESKKSVEVKSDEEVEDSPSELEVAKVQSIDAMMPVQEVANVTEKVVPLHMMLMNRKIVRPPSVILKKKRKDAFF